MRSPEPRSLFDRVWDRHQVVPEQPHHPAIVYIDLQLLHEVTSPQGFAELKRRGMKVRCPNRHIATLDHSTPTLPPVDGRRPYASEAARRQVEQLRTNCREHGIRLHDYDSPARGIVHVMGPDLGLTLPGMTIVCGDSHTTTHGAFGALAFGIGSSQVGHVMATQCLLMRKPKSMRTQVDGRLGPGVGAKDLALWLIHELGVSGGTGHVIEYAGSAIEALPMEGRMTLCNMSIEGGARAGMVAPDEVTAAYLQARRDDLDPDWIESWSSLRSDPGARFDREHRFDAGAVAPMVSWGTTPAMAVPVDQPIPEPANAIERRALDYMRLSAGKPVAGTPLDKVFIGSCTNGRLSDLEAAAEVLRGRKVAPTVRMIVVPGSETVKREAEARGLADDFRAAGAEWREPGCSMCLAMNGDRVEPGELAISTSNRNFEGRQGPGARTLLAGPAMAAASAVAGKVCDPRSMAELSEVA
ncbi:MAG: 3-isopropylmalate dehydratase large subunit [Candidatus Competibacterales bacterium]|nr:3-isopropylmalate dehydratase large subunit [Candidatus Competibacterales bacterium]